MSRNENGKKLKRFFTDMIYGYAIGIAFIIPGFSGGSVAAILGIYEKIVGAIADLFASFKKSLLILLPIAFGMALGIGSLIFPLGYALAAFPFPTVSLFVGLAIGGLPSVTDKLIGKVTPKNGLAFALPLLFALSLSFLPIGSDVDLFNLSAMDYPLLMLIGVVGSSALVVPGISGSMLLLIFGYYNPIVNMITDHILRGRDVGTSLLVLLVFAIGAAGGFFLISVVMKQLLKKCPRGTYFSILGFIIGSVPTVYISTAKDSGYTLSTLPTNVGYYLICTLMLVIGFIISFTLVRFAKKAKHI